MYGSTIPEEFLSITIEPVGPFWADCPHPRSFPFCYAFVTILIVGFDHDLSLTLHLGSLLASQGQGIVQPSLRYVTYLGAGKTSSCSPPAFCKATAQLWLSINLTLLGGISLRWVGWFIGISTGESNLNINSTGQSKYNSDIPSLPFMLRLWIFIYFLVPASLSWHFYSLTVDGNKAANSLLLLQQYKCKATSLTTEFLIIDNIASCICS